MGIGIIWAFKLTELPPLTSEKVGNIGKVILNP